MASQTKQYPKDGLVIISMLKEQGILNYEPRVINQLLEFATRYVSCVLDDARAFANHSKKKTIDVDDIKLAVGMQMEKVFTTPPPRDLLLEVARSKNTIPLPAVKPHCGIRLPPDRYCFSACNYKLKLSNKKMPEKVRVKYNLNSTTTGGMSTINTNTSNGPPLKMTKTSTGLNTSSAVGTSTSSTGVPVVKRSAASSVARSQAITAVAKPLIKLTTNPLATSSQQQSQPMVHAKARIQVTAGGNNSSVSTGTGTVVQQQQSQCQQIQQQTQQTPHQVEVKLEPNESASSTVMLSTNDPQMVGIKRKREEDFSGLE